MTVPVFAGLIWDTEGKPVEVRYVGTEPYYVVDDDGFLRHIPAAQIDRQILEAFKEQALKHRDAVVEGTLKWLGRDDLFTKAAVEASLQQMDQNIAQVLQLGLPDDARTLLGLIGFRVIVDMHGEIVDIRNPGAVGEEE